MTRIGEVIEKALLEREQARMGRAGILQVAMLDASKNESWIKVGPSRIAELQSSTRKAVILMRGISYQNHQT